MEIDLGKLPFDLDFHPSNQLVAAGLITGDLLLYRYAADTTPERNFQVSAHTESCRAVRFVNEGRAILTGSPDFSILATDVETGSPIARVENAHGAAVNRLVNLTDSTIASGDDEGCIKVWDTRQRSCCNSFSVHEEYISDMTFASDSMKLLATSGDGTLSVCNLRSNKVQTRSEFSEDELLSVVIMKNGRKVICGTQTGTILLYSWGFFKDCSDRFVDLSPNSIDALLKLDEDRVITASENGVISLVGILPNRIIQPIAEHSEYPVERLAFSHDKKFLGSISHDNMLKLWDLDDLLQRSGITARSSSAVEDSDSDEMDMDISLQNSNREERLDTGLFYIDDKYVDFKDVIEAPLPKAPLDTSIACHWLAIEGVQPAIPENAPVKAITAPETIKAEQKDDELPVDIRLPVKHVLSRELQLYFNKITELTLSRSDSFLFKEALMSLATDSGLHPLIPYFTCFIEDEVAHGLTDFNLLFALMRVVWSLLKNPHIHIEPYLHQLMPSVATFLVAKRLGNRLADNHWELRDFTADLVASICKRFGHVYNSLQTRVTKTLLHAFLDPKRAMTQHYGAIQGLAALGTNVVRRLILPNLETYVKFLEPEMLFEKQKNEMKRHEAWHVYGALLRAAGQSIYDKLKMFPPLTFPSAHTVWMTNARVITRSSTR